MNVETTYQRYLKLTGEAGAAASLVLAEAMSGAKPQRDEYMTVAQAANYFKLGMSTIYDACSSGKLRHSRAGKAIRLRREDLEQFLEGQESLFG